MAKKEGVEMLIQALKSTIRGVGPTSVGDIFDRYFDGGARKLGANFSAWLTQRSEVRQQ